MHVPVIIPESEQTCTEGFPSDAYGIVKWKTLVSRPKTSSAGLTSGIAECPPSTGHLCRHRHSQAEIYYIVAGTGEMSIDGVTSIVEKGAVVYIPGNSEHGIVNVGEGTLKWFYVFPTDSFEDIKYVFSTE